MSCAKDGQRTTRVCRVNEQTLKVVEHQVSAHVAQSLNYSFSVYASNLGLTKSSLASMLAFRAMRSPSNVSQCILDFTGTGGKITVRFPTLERKMEFKAIARTREVSSSQLLAALCSLELEQQTVVSWAEGACLTRSESDATLL